MIERFKGVSGRPLLVEAISNQYLIEGQHALAAQLADAGELVEYMAGAVLIQQGAHDNDIHFILSGSVAVCINGHEIATRDPNQQVGEMALIDPGAPRSATIIAKNSVVVLRVSETAFSSIANSSPRLWRKIAIELATRLRQRSKFIRQKNETPILFIGSSKEALPAVEQILGNLKGAPLIVRPWTDGVFGASNFPIEDLLAQVNESDFSALVLAPDDKVTSRGKEFDAPRDNVVFELGLFMGSIGRGRTFLITPKTMDVKVPSDLIGLTPLRYSPMPEDQLKSSLAAACEELKQAIVKLGPK